MSIIHEKLYQAKYFSSIDIRNLLSDIAGALVYSLRDMGKQIDLIVNIPDISVGIDTAIPLGLIVNEIVSNSLKHAFPSDMNGEIAINLHAVNEGFELSIRDTGIGFPDAFNMEKTDSLGMFLIYTLVEQLGGNIKIVSDNGTTITINFNRH